MSTEAFRQSPFTADQVAEARAYMEADAILKEDSSSQEMLDKGGDLGGNLGYVSDLMGWLDARREKLMMSDSKVKTEANIITGEYDQK